MHFSKIAITGGSGRLGETVVNELSAVADVHVLDLEPPKQDVPFTKCSVLEFDRLVEIFKEVDAVVHLAAIPNPRTAPADITFNVNVQGTFNVLEAAEQAGVKRVLVASSDAATGLHYNPPNWRPQYLPIDEDHPLRPTEFYSLSKEVTEVMARSYGHRGKIEVIAIRPTFIVMPQVIHELKARGEDPQNYHLWSYVAPEDVAQGIRLSLEYDKPIQFEAFQFAANESLCPLPTLEMMAKRYDTVPPVNDAAYFEGNPMGGVFSIRKAKEMLGYEPKITWQDMMAKQAKETA